jgi:hypothetical protein
MARPFARTQSVALPAMSGGLGAWSLGAALTLYLGLKGGGYDVVVRSQIGIAVWWMVVLGVVTGLSPGHRLSRVSRIALGLFAALAVWTATSSLWSESSERSVLEAGRLATYLGVLVLATSICSRDRVRPLLGGVASGVVVIAGLAAVSRLHPAWSPGDAGVTREFLPSARSRLAFPINYWNGLAALLALGLPLVVGFAATGRSLVVRCAATAAIPLLGLCWYLTLSRGGALSIAAACTVLLVLTPRRAGAPLILAVGGAGSAILIAGVAQRPALGSGAQSLLARHQGDELLILLLVVCAGVALLRLGAGLAADHELLPRLSGPRTSVRNLIATVAVGGVIGAALVTGVPSGAADRWKTFKNPQVGEVLVENRTAARFTSASGNGRYQFWRSAADGFESRPLIGVGAGAFEFWWARHATLPGFVRNAHSLYFETLAETGAVGLCLLLMFFASVFGGGLRNLRRAEGEHRALLAAALAGCAAFCVSSAVDWVWQIAVLPVGFLLLAAALCAGPGPVGARFEGPGRLSRMGLTLTALVAMALLAITLSGAVTLRDSQAAARRGDVPRALASATVSARLQPYAAAPAVQRALVLELHGSLSEAAASARRAQRREPTNWRAAYVLARIETRRGRVRQALVALRRARALNLNSTAIR